MIYNVKRIKQDIKFCCLHDHNYVNNSSMGKILVGNRPKFNSSCFGVEKL